MEKEKEQLIDEEERLTNEILRLHEKRDVIRQDIAMLVASFGIGDIVLRRNDSGAGYVVTGFEWRWSRGVTYLVYKIKKNGDLSQQLCRFFEADKYPLRKIGEYEMEK